MSASCFDDLKSVSVTVVSAVGKCPLGHKVGDNWLVKEGKTPDGMCSMVYHSLFQFIMLFQFDGAHPWDKVKGVARLGCPDAKERLVYELRVVKKD